MALVLDLLSSIVARHDGGDIAIASAIIGGIGLLMGYLMAMSGKMKFIDEIVVAVKFFIFDITVFFDRRFGISRLSAVGAVLGAVAATDICEQLDVDSIAFVFRS